MLYNRPFCCYHLSKNMGNIKLVNPSDIHLMESDICVSICAYRPGKPSELFSTAYHAVVSLPRG